MRIPQLRGQTLNTLVPTVIWGLAIFNAFMTVWAVSGLWFVAAAVGFILLCAGSAWAMARASTVLRDHTPAGVRVFLYLFLFVGMVKAAYDSVPVLEDADLPESDAVAVSEVPEEPAVTPVQEVGQWEAPHVPPGPARLPYVPDNVLDLIPQAQAMLGKTKIKVSQCGGKGADQARCVCDYVLAVTDKSGKIVLVDAYQDQESNPPGYKVKVQAVSGYERACGTNPILDVERPPGQTVLAIRTVVKTVRNQTRAEVFTPFSDELNLPELRENGLNYWWNTVVGAQAKMRSAGVRSQFQNALVADLIPAKHVLLLGLVENVGSLSPFGSSGSEKDRLRELQAVLVMFGANGTRAFDWRVSKADAHGVLQFTTTFQSLAGIESYRLAGLPKKDWVAGALNHQMAATAGFLHSDEEFRPLRKEWYAELPTHPVLYRLYLAAGFNGAARKASKALERCSAEEWYDGSCPILREETRWYLRKYSAVDSMLFDPRTHARLEELVSAPATK